MKLIIGGAYQGKLSYAIKEYDLGTGDIFDLSSGFPDRRYRCYFHLEALVKLACAAGKGAEEISRELLPFAEDAVVISREVGSGIVPMDASERLYRETCGLVLRAFADKADSVTRIFCGIPEILK